MLILLLMRGLCVTLLFSANHSKYIAVSYNLSKKSLLILLTKSFFISWQVRCIKQSIRVYAFLQRVHFWASTRSNKCYNKKKLVSRLSLLCILCHFSKLRNTFITFFHITFSSRCESAFCFFYVVTCVCRQQICKAHSHYHILKLRKGPFINYIMHNLLNTRS